MESQTNLRSDKKKSVTNDFYLLKQLKNKQKEVRSTLQEAQNNLLKLKRTPKYSKIQELEVQVDCFEEETTRLKEILDQTIQLRTNEIYNIEKITNLEERYYMQSNIVDGLRRDHQELSTALKVIED